MNDNFSKACGAIILLLLLLSATFALDTHAEEYTPPVEESTSVEQEAPEDEVSVTTITPPTDAPPIYSGVQTYDTNLYEKLDTLLEKLDETNEQLADIYTVVNEDPPEPIWPSELRTINTISGQLEKLQSTIEVINPEADQTAAFEKPFADYSVTEVLLLVLAAVVVGAIVIGLVRGF